MYRKIIVLKGLKLKNVALIKIIEINFEKGLNVFTGESGSGKSLILDSLNSLFGGTNIPINHLIRPDKSECLIEATFNHSKKISDWLSLQGYIITSKDIVITRKTYRSKEKIFSIFKVNQFKVNKKLIQLLGVKLIDFAGQSDTFHFGSEEYLRSIIDELGSSDLEKINLQVKTRWHELSLLKKEIKTKSLQIAKEEENFFAKEKILKILEDANLTDKYEIINLKSQELRLSNNYDLSTSIKNTLSLLNSFDSETKSVNTLVYDSIKEMNKVSKYDQVIEKYIDQLLIIQNKTEEIIYSLSHYLKLADNDDEQLPLVQQRLFDLQNLEKTFSLELPELINKRNELREKTNLLDRKEEIKELNSKLTTLDKEFKKLLASQSFIRKKIAVILENNVISKLKNLGLGNAIFKVDFKKSEPNAEGQDSIKFLFSANPDQSLALINKVISGGEMSRFLLALKSSIPYVPDTLFFDEIDNGLSGRSLNCLLKLIKVISSEKQVLCITHQPSLAASAKTHFKVEKDLRDGKTFTKLSKLTTKAERQKQLAELIGVDFAGANNYALTLLNKEAS